VVSIDSIRTMIGVTNYVFQCRSLSGTVVQLSLSGTIVTGSWQRGLLGCPDSTALVVLGADSVTHGHVKGDSITFAILSGVQLRGTMDMQANPITAHGTVDSVLRVLGGRWSATKHAPTGGLAVTYTRLSGTAPDSMVVDVDGSTAFRIPPNTTDTIMGLAGGLHQLRSYFTYGSCLVTPSTDMYQFFHVAETGTPLAITVAVSC
jgi:hypothetical protein